MTEDQWITHLRRLAKENADLRLETRKLRMKVTALQDDLDHYSREFSRQNAELLTLKLVRKVKDV